MHPPNDESRFRVVVVGAGQAGLSVAYELQRRSLRTGREVLVVDRGPSTGGAWQFRWEALRLGLAHRVHDLPGMHAMGLRFDDADRERPARDVVEEYYRRYEEEADIAVRRPVEATAVRSDGDDLVVELTTGTAVAQARTGGTVPVDGAPADRGRSGGAVPVDGTSTDRGRSAPAAAVSTIRTEVLVSATGTWGTPFRPWYPGLDVFGGRQLDTTGYRAASDFAGQDVVVVGGGTSAIGFVLELEGIASSVSWYARRPVQWLEESSLDLESAVSAVAAQDRAARAGEALPSIVGGTGVPMTPAMRAAADRGVLVPRPMFARFDAGGVVHTDGSHRHADAVIWATGFRPELRYLAPLGLRERSDGYRVHDGVSDRDPRVFLAGYGPQASTIGANRAGRLIARQVLARLGSTP